MQEVIKRDGRIVPFNQECIFSAIHRAHTAAYDEASEFFQDKTPKFDSTFIVERCSVITSAVVERLFADYETAQFEVEFIQDCVEEELMRAGYYSVARLYIKYREKHKEAREFYDSIFPEDELSNYITASRYAQYAPELLRRVTLNEMVDRVVEMHVRRNPQIEEQLRWAFEYVRNKTVLPSMRSFQFGGLPIEEKNPRIFNCIAGPVDSIDFFREYMYLLLCGCGVGYAVDYEFIEKLPPIAGSLNEDHIVHHTIEDSIEGWAWSVDVLIRSFIEGYVAEFNYSQIRPKGSPIRTGGRAPGHVPLRRALDQIRAILYGSLGRQLEPIEIFDINCLIADAVLAGGVRRSATIAIFSADDLDMRRAKTGDWNKTHPHRARANISVRLLRGEVSERDFKRVFKFLRDWGEPGFFFCNSIYEIPNPCVPGETRILTRKGYVQIKDVVDQEVEVWNGYEWSAVIPKVTGHDQKIVTVTLSDGSELTCTDYHNWHIQRGFARDGHVEVLPAKDLKPGDKLIKVDMPVVPVGKVVDPEIAYTQGVFAGDGCESRRKHVTLYGEKIGLQKHLHIRHALPLDTQRNRQRVDLHVGVHESKFFVPHDWDLSARLAWLAGLIDTDGCLVYSDTTKTSASIQISSVEKGFLQEIRLMLTTLGIQAQVLCDDNLERVTLMPDGNGGSAEYPCRTAYRLLISSMDVYALKELGIPLHRIDLAEVQKPKRDARRFVEIVSVEDAGVEGTVYCFTEPKRNLGTFEGIITGQCCEIVLYCLLPDGSTGFQACNLSTINGGLVTSADRFYEYARAAAIIGTSQASFTDFDPEIFRPATRQLIEREALIGVSMTAILANPEVTLDESVVRKAAMIVKSTNAEIAEIIGINAAARTTCVKPEGTSTLQLGLTMSGIHPAHAPYYFRRVTANKKDPVYQWFKEHNPHMCQESVWSTNKTDDVITFPVKAPESALLRKDIKNVDHLQLVLNWQQWWVETGQAYTTYTAAHHNVSNTVTYDLEHWEEVADFIWKHRLRFTGITLLRYESDKIYPQAVFEEVVTPEDRLHYVNIIKNFTPVDYTAMQEIEDGTDLQREWACAGGSCQI